MFVFSNRSRQAIKILFYDGQGFWVFHKRLSSGKFKSWPKSEGYLEIVAQQLLILIWNGDFTRINFQKNWKNILQTELSIE